MLVFLQNWRSAIIPLVAVPVAIIGTFAAMAAVGFSLNNLTLFGLVLAIGIVVDDAIVVVEAVEHHIEHGLSPRDATIKAMEQVSGPVIAVGLVLTAVFVPCTFITGIVGQFFRQFALTIAISTIISAFNSLTLSPALAALLLQPKHERGDPLTRLLDFAARLVLPPVQPRLPHVRTSLYARVVGMSLRVVSIVVWSSTAGLLVLTDLAVPAVAHRLHSPQDKGYFLASVQLPDAAVAGADARRHGENRARSPRKRRRRRTSTPSPATRSCSAPTARTSARCSSFSKDFDERRNDPKCRATPCWPSCERGSPRKCPRRRSSIFPAAGGVRAWAGPAASSS